MKMYCDCKEISSLRALCLKTVEASLISLFTEFLNSTSAFADCSEHLERTIVQACNMPESLRDEVTQLLLRTAYFLSRDVNNIDSKEQSVEHRLVVQHLVSAVTRLKPKKISLHYIRCSILVYSAFYNILNKFRGVQSFCCQRLASLTLEKQSFLENYHPSLINLLTFRCSDCSDEILAAICESCTLIEVICVAGTKVTNNCISSLVRSKKLRTVDLKLTSVTFEGYTRLLLDTQSHTLADISEYKSKPLVTLFNHLETIPSTTFSLQKFGYHSDALVPDTNFFLQLVKFFPDLTYLELLFHFCNLPPNLAVLDQLKSVREATLDIVVFEEDDIFLENLVSLKSSILTCLCVWYYGKLPLTRIRASDIINIGLNCPNLESLLIPFFFFTNDISCAEFDQLPTKPFLKLRELSFNKSGSSIFKLILCHTFSIQSICIKGEEGLTDDFFMHIFNCNPLERLQVLHIVTKNEISAHVLKFIITNCPRLTRLGCFEKFTALSRDEREEIHAMVAKRYDLKLT